MSVHSSANNPFTNDHLALFWYWREIPVVYDRRSGFLCAGRLIGLISRWIFFFYWAHLRVVVTGGPCGQENQPVAIPVTTVTWSRGHSLLLTGLPKQPESQGGGGGGGLVLTLQGCVSKTEGHGSLFQLQGSEMSENISRKMGLQFAASLNMGENLCGVLYIITYEVGENELPST